MLPKRKPIRPQVKRKIKVDLPLTVTTLAAHLGRNHGTVSRWIERADWRWGRGPWGPAVVQEISRWSKSLQENRSDTPGSNADGANPDLQRATQVAKLQLLVERKASLTVAREIMQQKRVLRDEMEAEQARKYNVIRRALMQVPRSLRQILADTTDPAEVERILINALQVICNEGFQGGVAAPIAGAQGEIHEQA